METLVQDVRYACRQFVRRPGFTAIAVLSLALAIGGNSLIFGLLDGFVFNPFPYPDPDRLVAIGVTFPKVSSDTTYIEALSPAEYLDIKASQSFSAPRRLRSRQPQYLRRRRARSACSRRCCSTISFP